MLIQVSLPGYKLTYTSSFFRSSPLTLISVNSKVNSKVLSLCVNMLKHAYAPTHLLFFTIFWCIFIVYTLINGLIHCISSIISSSFFYIKWIYALQYQFKSCFSVSIKFLKIFSKTYNKRRTNFWEIRFQNYTMLYQHL